MTQYTFRTSTQSNGPETFEAGEVAIDVVRIPVAELLATFPALANGDTVLIRKKSGLRQYVPELCYVYTDATVTAGNASVFVDGNTANVIVPGASFASGPVRTGANTAAYTYALYNTTPDAGSDVGLNFTTIPVGSGYIIVQIATRPAQT